MAVRACDPRTQEVSSTVYTIALMDVTTGRRLNIAVDKACMDEYLWCSASQDCLRALSLIVRALAANLALYQVLLASSLEVGETSLEVGEVDGEVAVANGRSELGRLVMVGSSIACRRPIYSNSPCPYELLVERTQDEKGRQVFWGEFQLAQAAFMMQFRGGGAIAT